MQSVVTSKKLNIIPLRACPFTFLISRFHVFSTHHNLIDTIFWRSVFRKLNAKNKSFSFKKSFFINQFLLYILNLYVTSILCSLNHSYCSDWISNFCNFKAVSWRRTKWWESWWVSSRTSSPVKKQVIHRTRLRIYS